MKQLTRAFTLLATVLSVAACADVTETVGPDARLPMATAPADPATLLSLTCVASPQTRTVNCDPLIPSDGFSRDVIIGGQNQYVTLASSNIAVVADTFEFDVTVQNLIPQPIGTTNGSTADPAGIRVFFHSGPTSTGAGSVSVKNPDGTGTFTGANQPYFQYNGILENGQVSPVKRWKLELTPGVPSFTFQVYVSTNVQYPVGYVDELPYVLSLDPSESRALTGVVRSMVGNALPGETVSWSSNAPGTAAVVGTTVTAGASRGFATLTSSSGARPGTYTTAVSVCQSAVVTNGTSLPSSIAASDCFSSYGSSNGTPSANYYADLYRVTLTAGQTITVTMDSGDNLDTYLLVAHPAFGALVAGNDDDDEGILGVGSRVVYTATTTGVYVIEASTFNSITSGNNTGNYTLNVVIN